MRRGKYGIHVWRLRFHDWIWQGSSDGKRVREWLAPKLPIFLSDPFLPATKRGRQKLFDLVEEKGEPTVGPPVELRVRRK